MSGQAGQKQIVTVPHSTTMTPVVSSSSSMEVAKPQSLLMTSLTSPPKPITPKVPGASPEKFELTQDYIQQTIQAALKKDNLSPEVEQKLLALQQAHKGGGPVLVKKQDKPIDPATGEPMDDEWDGAGYAERSIALKNRRKKQEESVIAERIQ